MREKKMHGKNKILGRSGGRAMGRILSNRLSGVAACLPVVWVLATVLSVGCIPTASAESFIAVDLYTLTGPAGITSVNASTNPQAAAPGGGVVGAGSGTGTGNKNHALLWNGTGVATDLNPTNLAGFSNSQVLRH